MLPCSTFLTRDVFLSCPRLKYLKLGFTYRYVRPALPGSKRIVCIMADKERRDGTGRGYALIAGLT